MLLGLSSCPNDTFIFHALLDGLVQTEPPLQITPHMADVETLNSLAMKGELEITKISLGVMPHIQDKYALCSSGAALGWGCGPLLVARKNMTEEELRKADVAIPGKKTTASLLLDLVGEFAGKRREMIFSDVIPAVAGGEVDLGVIIHEGRFTYQQAGLVKILDLGQWWEANFHLPLPLGAIAIRRDVPMSIARSIQKGIAESLAYARRNPGAALDFARRYAQELSEDVILAHINTFVTEYSMDLGDLGKKAIRTLMGVADQQYKDHSLFIDEL